jgi:NTE family protein
VTFAPGRFRVCEGTIEVESADVGVLDFDISRKRLEEFYDNGYAAAQQFLSSWGWAEYLDQFRHSRWRLASPD